MSAVMQYTRSLGTISRSSTPAFARAAVGIWDVTNGKKAVMAVSGLILFGFLAGHLAGNLQVFLGAEVFNHYAATLKSLPALLWGTRITLLVMVVLHVWSAASLWSRKRGARPVAYIKKKSIASTYASRVMYMSGPILAAFIIYHLLHFTVGAGGTSFEEGKAYENLVAGFKVWYIAVFYILSMALLCLHLYHGIWSMAQTLGFHHPKYTPKLRQLSKLIAVAFFLGFSSIPLGVQTRIIKPVILFI